MILKNRAKIIPTTGSGGRLIIISVSYMGTFEFKSTVSKVESVTCACLLLDCMQIFSHT
jgi:hypothetical protein